MNFTNTTDGDVPSVQYGSTVLAVAVTAAVTWPVAGVYGFGVWVAVLTAAVCFGVVGWQLS